MPKILCAVDFSASARAAVERAADLARRLEGDLTLVHVRAPPTADGSGPRRAQERADADRRELLAKLETWRAEAERQAGRPVEARLAHGAPAAEIVATARGDAFDVVVTGAGPRPATLGAVAERVAREAPCTVVIARPGP